MTRRYSSSRVTLTTQAEDGSYVTTVLPEGTVVQISDEPAPPPRPLPFPTVEISVSGPVQYIAPLSFFFDSATERRRAQGRHIVQAAYWAGIQHLRRSRRGGAR